MIIEKINIYIIGTDPDSDEIEDIKKQKTAVRDEYTQKLSRKIFQSIVYKYII